MSDYEHDRLKDVAAELARWQGRMEATVAENTRRLDAINGSIDSIDDGITEIKIELGILRTKVAIGSALGGLIGAGLVTFILQFTQ